MGLFDILGQGIKKAGGFIQKNPALATTGLVGLGATASAAGRAPYNVGALMADYMQKGQEMAIEGGEFKQRQKIILDREKQKEVFGKIMDIFREADEFEGTPEEERSFFAGKLSELQKETQIDPETLGRAIQAFKGVGSVMDDFVSKASSKTTQEVMDGISKGTYASPEDIVKGIGGRARYVNWDQLKSLGEKWGPPKDWAALEKEADIKAKATAKAQNMVIGADEKELNRYIKAHPELSEADAIDRFYSKRYTKDSDSGLNLGKYATISSDTHKQVDDWAKNEFYDEMGESKNNPATNKPYSISEISNAKQQEYQRRMASNTLTDQNAVNPQLLSDQDKQKIVELNDYAKKSGIPDEEVDALYEQAGWDLTKAETLIKGATKKKTGATPESKAFPTNKAAIQQTETPKAPEAVVPQPVETTETSNQKAMDLMDSGALEEYNSITDKSVKPVVDKELMAVAEKGQPITANDVKAAKNIAMAKKKGGIFGVMDEMN